MSARNWLEWRPASCILKPGTPSVSRDRPGIAAFGAAQASTLQPLISTHETGSHFLLGRFEGNSPSPWSVVGVSPAWFAASTGSMGSAQGPSFSLTGFSVAFCPSSIATNSAGMSQCILSRPSGLLLRAKFGGRARVCVVRGLPSSAPLVIVYFLTGLHPVPWLFSSTGTMM